MSFPLGLPIIKIDQLKSSSLPFNSANCFLRAQLSINNWFRAILAGKMAQQDKNLLYEASSLWSIDRPTQVLIHSKRKRSHSFIICSNGASLPISFPINANVSETFLTNLYTIFYNLWDKNSFSSGERPSPFVQIKDLETDRLTHWPIGGTSELLFLCVEPN